MSFVGPSAWGSGSGAVAPPLASGSVVPVSPVPSGAAVATTTEIWTALLSELEETDDDAG